jgi:uncharacterized membrane protein YphA (DoxX/SURF4 family)
MTKALPSSTTYARWLGLIRIVVGAMWIGHAITKFLNPDTFMPPNGAIVQIVTQGSQQGSHFMRPFFANVVLPNIALFAELVRLGEALVGIALILGLLTRLGGFGGMFLTFFYASTKGPLLSLATLSGSDFAMFVLSGMSFVLPTGRALGLDALLSRRRRTVPTVRAEFVPEPPLITPPPPSPEPAPPSSAAAGSSGPS